MVATLLTLREFFFKKKQSLTVESSVSKLLYRYTCILHIGLFMLIEGYKHNNYPILCTEELSLKVNAFCHGNSFENRKSHENTLLYSNYYPHASITFLFFAALYYAPHFIWRFCEMSKIADMINGLNRLSDLTEESDIQRLNFQTAIAAERFSWSQKTCSFHKLYLCRVICDILYLIVIGFQISWIMSLFGTYGNFFNYGSTFLYLTLTTGGHQYAQLFFPPGIICPYKEPTAFGLELREKECYLPVNEIMPHVFLVLWIWIPVTVVVNFLHLTLQILSAVYIVGVKIRAAKLKMKCPTITNKKCEFLAKHLNLNSYLMIQIISENVSTNVFTAYVEALIEIANAVEA